MGKKNYIGLFWNLVVAAAVAICCYCVYTLPTSRLDPSLIIVTLTTIAFSSLLTIQIPKAKVHISVSDSLIFLTLLVYGSEVAVLLAAVEAACASLGLRKKGVFIRFDGILFNAALMTLSTFVTGRVVVWLFGANSDFNWTHPGELVAALCVMAFIQCVVNSGLAAVYTTLENNSSFWSTWLAHYFPATATYIVGAAVAGGLVKLIEEVGFYVALLTVPLLAIVYLTQRRYIDDIKAQASLAEQSERARAQAESERAEAEYQRAELERERAEQAERHVVELNHHIAEQQRISKELEGSKERFRHAAYHDALTGLPNRVMFTEVLQVSMDRPENAFAVLFLDLDRFKNINDSLGHRYGDQLLIAIAERLRSCVRQSDMVARFGGDEFAVLLEGYHDLNDVQSVAEKIQRELALPLKLDRHEAFTTASIGIALSSTGYDCPEDVLRDADTAMYRAKERGKARHEVFDNEMHARVTSLMRTESELRRAMERQELPVFYQPIISLRSGEVAGFEALVRWQHPTRGLISPHEFLPIAEETGLVVPIGKLVLEEACTRMRAWQEKSPAHRSMSLSVNLSAKQLTQPDLIEEVEEILCRTGFDPHCLKLEITETVVMENAELAAILLKRLRALGVRVSIDDFGTGYSSLSYLHRFPVDVLKIDRSFVGRMNQGDENLEIVRTILTLAHNLGMEVVAEGVETQEQCVQLKTLKCEYGQGYFFAEPLSADATMAWLEEISKTRQRLDGPRLSETQPREIHAAAEFELTDSRLVM